MKQKRVKADYKNFSSPRLNEEVQRMLLEAHRFCAVLETLNAEYPHLP
jgi:hypothetical protein